MEAVAAEQPANGAVLEEGPSARFVKSLAVVIGIDRYGGGIAPLRSAVADAAAIAEALQRDHGFEIRRVFDEEASRARLLALLAEELPAALGPDDRLLVYFAGHGIALDGDAGPAGYLVPADARREDRDGFVPMHAVNRALAGLPVRHAFVILDCCFAGTFRWSSLRDLEPAVQTIYRERYDRYLESPAWQALTSASADQLALDMLADGRGEGTGRHSPFALALLEGLGGAADFTGDHLVTASELAMFAAERVAPAAESAGRRQIPQLFPLDRHDSGEFVFQVPGRTLALAPAPPLDEAANPYRGLESFREQDRVLFFGRAEAARRLVEAVIAQRLTVVVGPSGAGKSSLVHAALVPELRERGWTVLPAQRPGRDPLAALDAWARALRPELVPTDPAAAWRTVAASRGEEPWLVVVDQLEELLTYRTPERHRTAFLEALAGAMQASPSLRVVVTVRSDSEPQLHDTALGPWWAAARFVVPAPGRDELREIIERPAAAAVLCFEPSRLVERLLDDVALVPAPLPLLSFALSELYRRCEVRWRSGIRDRALRGADYDEMGSVARALTLRATALHDELAAEDPAYAGTIRNVFCRMVAVVDGELARRRVPTDELAYGDPEDRRVAEVLQRFHDARLLSLGTEDGGAYAEPIHDELVRGWPQLRRWVEELDTPVGTRALVAAVGGGARTWRAGGEKSDLLWSDARVELASALRRERPFVFNTWEARFVQRGARRRRRRRWVLLGGLTAASCVLAIAAVLALWQRGIAVDNEARAIRNEERATANEAEARRQLARWYQETAERLLAEGRPTQAIPYLVEARKRGGAVGALRVLFWRASRQLLALRLPNSVVDPKFSPDGARVVTVSWNGSAQLWDTTTGKPASASLGDSHLLDTDRRSTGSAAFSPDGTRVVTASWNGRARVWDARTGDPVSPPLVHARDVEHAAFSPDGARVVTASWDRTARVWDARTGWPRSPPLQHQKSVASAAFSPDGTRVVTASRDGTARVWDARTGRPLSPPLQHRAEVDIAAFSADGTRVVTEGLDETARVWDASTGKPVSPPLQAIGRTAFAGFSPDGNLLVTVGADHARLWSASTGESISPPLVHLREVTSVAFSPDSTRVVTASSDRTARVWDARTGAPVSPPLVHLREVRSAAFSPDGARVVTASSDRTARVWDASTGNQVQPPFEHAHGVVSAAFSPDGTRVITRDSDRTVQIWDALTTWPAWPPIEHRDRAVSAAFSPDGTRVVIVSSGAAARVWSASTGKPVGPPLGSWGGVKSAAFSSDGLRVVTASPDRTARVWDAMTGKPASPPLDHPASVHGAVLSPDGAHVVTAGEDGAARVWNVATGALVLPLLQHGGPVVHAAFSQDGRRIVTSGEDRTTRVWSAATGTPISLPVEHQVRVTHAAFSADAERVLVVSPDRTVRVWDAITRARISPPLKHPEGAWTAALSPDGARVVTAGMDGTARIWDAATGSLLYSPLEHRSPVIGVAFSSDGTRLVTVGEDRIVRIWVTPFDRGTLADWEAIAEKVSPYVLVDGTLVPRTSTTTEGR